MKQQRPKHFGLVSGHSAACCILIYRREQNLWHYSTYCIAKKKRIFLPNNYRLSSANWLCWTLKISSLKLSYRISNLLLSGVYGSATDIERRQHSTPTLSRTHHVYGILICCRLCHPIEGRPPRPPWLYLSVSGFNNLLMTEAKLLTSVSADEP